MTREEQAKEAYKDYMNNGGAFQSNPWFYFKAGTEWANKHPNLDSLWYSASEKPRAKEWILIQFSGDDYEALALDDLGVETWSDWWCDNYKVRRWAYISDLMPKGGKR